MKNNKEISGSLLFLFLIILILISKITIASTINSTVTINTTSETVITNVPNDGGGTTGGGGGGGCLTSWKCTEWSQCADGKQQRVCSKESPLCYASEKDKPSETQDCNGNINPILKNEIPQTLFDINIKAVKSIMLKKEKFSAVVKLMNLGQPGQVNATVKYTIMDSQNNMVYQETQIVLVETQTEFIKEFSLDMAIGTYTITADLSYNGQIEPAQSVDNFEVTNIIQTNSITGFSAIVQNSFSKIGQLFKELINWLKMLLD